MHNVFYFTLFCRHLHTSIITYNSILALTGSQCNCFIYFVDLSNLFFGINLEAIFSFFILVFLFGHALHFLVLSLLFAGCSGNQNHH